MQKGLTPKRFYPLQRRRKGKGAILKKIIKRGKILKKL
jgi:hypothetical protein